jgi:hypothetical protein
MDLMNGLYQALFGWLINIVLVTDPAATYNNPVVLQFWWIALYITDAGAAIFFVLAGYRIIISGFNAQYAQLLDLLPRVAFALVGAHMSWYLAALIINLNNGLCEVFLVQRNLTTFLTDTTHLGLLLPYFQIVAGLLMLLLCLQMTARIALLDFLIVILPWLFLLLANKTTEHIGRAGIEAYWSTALIQCLQVVVLVMGQRILLPFLEWSIGSQSFLSPLTDLIVAIALFALTLQIPMIVGRMVLHPVAQTGGGVRTVITFLIARLV